MSLGRRIRRRIQQDPSSRHSESISSSEDSHTRLLGPCILEAPSERRGKLQRCQSAAPDAARKEYSGSSTRSSSQGHSRSLLQSWWFHTLRTVPTRPSLAL